jgi:hypothetical protein
MKRTTLLLSVYALFILLVTPMLTLASHSVGHPCRVLGGTVLAGLTVGIAAKLIARRFI